VPWRNQKQANQNCGSGRKAVHAQTPSPSGNIGKNKLNACAFARQAITRALIPWSVKPAFLGGKGEWSGSDIRIPSRQALLRTSNALHSFASIPFSG
jgi:hypothetical protein